MNTENLSPLASGIIQGLQEAIADSKGESVNDIKKTVVDSIQPQTIRHQLQMSQSQFAKAFGIPLRTLQGWELGKKKLDTSIISYLRTIAKFPNEVQAALAD